MHANQFVKWALTIGVGLTSACVTSTITPFQSAGGIKESLVPTKPEDIEIYRSTKPPYAFIELGMISFRTGYMNLSGIYDQLRKDSAKQGANAVLDVKIIGETHTETESKEKCETKQDCSAIDGSCTTKEECHTENVDKQVSSFTIEGTLIKRKL
jgi:hypothetical protein